LLNQQAGGGVQGDCWGVEGGGGEGDGGKQEEEWEAEEVLQVATEEHVIARLLTHLVQANIQRDDAERVFRFTSSLRALDAARASLAASLLPKP